MKIVGKITEVGAIYPDHPKFSGVVIAVKIGAARVLAGHLYGEARIVFGDDVEPAKSPPWLRRVLEEIELLVKVRESFALLEARETRRERDIQTVLRELARLRQQLPAELAQIAALLAAPVSTIGSGPCEGRLKCRDGTIYECCMARGHAGDCRHAAVSYLWRGKA